MKNKYIEMKLYGGEVGDKYRWSRTDDIKI
jgi:hypothetical protein